MHSHTFSSPYSQHQPSSLILLKLSSFFLYSTTLISYNENSFFLLLPSPPFFSTSPIQLLLHLTTALHSPLNVNLLSLPTFLPFFSTLPHSTFTTTLLYQLHLTIFSLPTFLFHSTLPFSNHISSPLISFDSTLTTNLHSQSHIGDNATTPKRSDQVFGFPDSFFTPISPLLIISVK